MKKDRIFVLIVGIALIVLSIVYYMEISSTPKGIALENGVVPAEETAIQLAECIWISIYGGDIYFSTPFVTNYN